MTGEKIFLFLVFIAIACVIVFRGRVSLPVAEYDEPLPPIDPRASEPKPGRRWATMMSANDPYAFAPPIYMGLPQRIAGALPAVAGSIELQPFAIEGT